METASGLNVLLSRLESKKQADQTFSKNLEFLKSKSPDLYNRISNYKPDRLIPTFDHNGDINLQNASGSYVYPEAPVNYAEKQVDEFLNKTKCRLIRYQDATVIKQKAYVHQQMMESMFELYPADEIRATPPNNDDMLQMVIICGIGTGLHIDRLLDQKAVRNLIIYDTDLSGFFASLFFVEWSRILRKVSGAIEVILEEDQDLAIARFNSFFSEYGYFNLSKYYVYYHYDNPQLRKFVGNLKERVLKSVSGFGFYDDERVGLAHTLKNINGGYGISRVALNTEPVRNKTPVFVIGNGPSLDESIEYIRAHKDGCILISCGSAIGTLEKLGIKPDIHVEQERALSQYDWLTNCTSKSFRQGIHFVGLNTIYPSCFELFDQDKSYICIKPNDLGMIYVKNALDKVQGNTLAIADGCNPTVTNFGVALAVILGFENIYLAGVDCGMEKLDVHHASRSHYQENKDKSEYAKKGYSNSGFFRVKGAQSKLVYTTATLNNTRIEIERLINKYNLNVCNLGCGAFINGAQNTTPDQLAPIDSSVDPAKLAEIFSRTFHDRDLSFEEPEAIRKNVMSEVALLNQKLLGILQQSKISTEEDLYSTLRLLKDTFNAAEVSEYSSWFMRGSLEYILAVISSLYAYRGAEDYDSIGLSIKGKVADFFAAQENNLENNFYDLADYTSF